jgi:OOP family OmpA-OmpF porin
MMKYIRALTAVTLIASVALTSVPAFAQDAGFYAGGAIGQSRLKGACDGLTIACDDKDTAWKIFGGYQFNKNFGLEVGYVDMGKANASGTITGVAVNGEIKGKGWEFLGVGTIPFTGNLSGYGKLGLVRWDVDAFASAALGGNIAVGNASDKGTSATYGLGLKYDFTKNVGARLEWQRYNNIGNDSTTGQGDVDLYSVGIVFKF